jgi:hypothetical protein
VNEALLDTDIFSEITKGIDPNVARNATAYRATFGRYTISVITIRPPPSLPAVSLETLTAPANPSAKPTR